jgi:uncharacterized membrane protein YdjX (TVP38/TMEM64 family)
MSDAARPRFFTVGRVVLLLAIAGGATIFFLSGAYEHFKFETIKERRDWLKEQAEQHLLIAVVLYFGLYVTVASLSLPISTVVSLLGGFLFDFWLGVVLVSFASTSGSTLAFLGSRYLFRDFVQRRFGKWLDAANRGLDKDGLYYLLTLRLIPYVPFFVVNFVMGLTGMPARTFWWVSQLGMLPATCLYVNAGKQLGTAEELKHIPLLLLSLALLGAAPLAFRALVKRLRPSKTGIRQNHSHNGEEG